MSTPGPGQGSYESRLQPPGGMGVTTQGFGLGQEGYVLPETQALPKPPPEAENFAVGVPYFLDIPTFRDALQGLVVKFGKSSETTRSPSASWSPCAGGTARPGRCSGC
jgi:hypothetical protein